MQNLVTKPVEKRESRIYVGSLHYDIKEADVRALFESFGPIRYSEMQMDPLTGKSKGFCFLEFETPEASDAAQAMDGFELAGRRVTNNIQL
jgi:RNA recognition motif-containing protein